MKTYQEIFRILCRIMTAALLLLFMACTSAEHSYLTISPNTRTIVFSAGATESYTFTVDMNWPDGLPPVKEGPTWKAVSNQPWCKVEMNADAGTGTFTVTALPNTSSTPPPPALITVTSNNRADVILIDVTQMALTERDIYVAGYCRIDEARETACYWKNGVRTVLPRPAESGYSLTRDITVSDGLVYISGEFSSQACYWKDGEYTILPGYYSTSAIDVENGSVYVLGYENYWKDLTSINVNAPDFTAKDLAVCNGSVYIAGQVHLSVGNSTSKAYLWNNGRARELQTPAGTTFSDATCIYASGGSVYVGGYYRSADGLDIPCYWKDGVCTSLELRQGAEYSMVEAICVANGKVYAAGFFGSTYIHPCCWKEDGKLTPLSHPGDVDVSEIAGITVAGQDIYVLGSCVDQAGEANCCYWINGQRILLPMEDGMTEMKVSGIAVVEK